MRLSPVLQRRRALKQIAFHANCLIVYGTVVLSNSSFPGDDKTVSVTTFPYQYKTSFRTAPAFDIVYLSIGFPKVSLWLDIVIHIALSISKRPHDHHHKCPILPSCGQCADGAIPWGPCVLNAVVERTPRSLRHCAMARQGRLLVTPQGPGRLNIATICQCRG